MIARRDATCYYGLMLIAHTAVRNFMLPNDLEPNEQYRPWLETHIGKQGVDWTWDLCRTNLDLLEINFADKTHAIFFELVWP